MTVEEVFAQVDELKPNQYDDQLKLIWLNDLEGRIQRELLKKTSYTKLTLDDMDTELSVVAPYDNLYRLYVMLMIDYSNAEFTRYAQSLAMFNEAYQEYANYINRTTTQDKNRLKLFT